MRRNILIVASHLFIGGAEIVIADLCRHLDRKKFNVSICCLKERGDIGDDLYSKGHDVFSIQQSGPSKQDYLSFLKLRKIVQERKIDVVHSHTTHSLIDASLCKLTLKKLKMIHTFHFGNYPNYNKRYLVLEKIFCRVPDTLVAVGNEQKQKIKNTFRIGDRKIQTIWNGVKIEDNNLEASTVNSFRSEGKIIIGTVCTLIEQKGLTYLLDVAFSLKQKKNNVLFLIAGEGHLRERLEAKARQLGLEDYVIFLGWVKNAVSDFIPTVDIFVLPSLWEAMSVVVLEAMGAGKPVVVTSVGENRHVIEDGVNGLLVEPKNVDEMVIAVERLIHNPELRIELGIKAKRKVDECCNVNKMINNYERLYMELL